MVPDGGNHLGDEGYQARLFAAFEAGLIVEDEWRVVDRAHRFVFAAERLS